MANVELQERDYQIINFIKEFKCVTSEIIADLYFNDSKNKILVCNRRLKKLCDARKLNRNKNRQVLEPFIYYKGSCPINAKHALLVAKAYVDINSKYKILSHKVECEIKVNNNQTLRADLVCVILDENNKPKPLIIEVSNRSFYKDKWTEYITSGQWQNKFGAKPEIIVYSRFNSYSSSIPITFIKLDVNEGR